jgi:hypothetical protein
MYQPRPSKLFRLTATPQIFYCTGGPIAWWNGLPAAGDGYLAWLKYLLDLEHIPPTMSISYANPETSVPWTYAYSLCNVFAQLGLRGVSVLIATGDVGVGGGNCLDGDGNVRFYTTFPASCTSCNLSSSTEKYLISTGFSGPWVTSVGGTMAIPEVAMPLSGGGFSEYFRRPMYQNGAVLTYLQNLGSQYAGLYKCVPVASSVVIQSDLFILCNLYSPVGRGVPDISAQSYDTCASSLPFPLRPAPSMIENAAENQRTDLCRNNRAAK